MAGSRQRVLIVDDEAYVRESLEGLLSRRGFSVRSASSAREGLQAALAEPLDVVVTDMNLGGPDGFELLRSLVREAPGVPVIVLTGHGSVDSAVTCLKAGAFDYLEKPADPDALVLAVERATGWASLRRELEVLRRESRDAGGPIGRSSAWMRAVRTAHAAAETDSTVLLLGESGSGKEVLAHEIHDHSERAEGPFVPVNCAAIPSELVESEFFGHRKGAFTGAVEDREGRFRLAHGGTLFLDEVGCLPLAAQAKLLRVLQDHTFERVGDTRRISSDVRVIAATNQDLHREVEEGRFRQDLLYRLNVLPIEVPPLRARVEDIPLLAAHFLSRIAARLNRPVRDISPGALQILCDYEWPGNVRELENVLERAVILERGESLTPASFGFLRGAPTMSPQAEEGEGSLDLRKRLKEAEKQLLEEALRRSGGVKQEAARLLGVDPRNLSYYLRKHGLHH